MPEKNGLPVISEQPKLPERPEDVAPGGYYYYDMGQGNAPEKRRRAWTWSDVEARLKSGEFKLHDIDSAAFTGPLIWQGLTMYVIAGESARVATPFFDLYQQSIRDQRAVDQAARKLFNRNVGDPWGPGESGIFTPGGGALAANE